MWIITPLFFYIFIAGGAGEIVSQSLFVKISFAGLYAVLGVSGLVCIGVRRLCYQGHNRDPPAARLLLTSTLTRSVSEAHAFSLPC